MTEKEKKNLSEGSKGQLFVSNQYFHHHSLEIINSYKDLKDKFLESLSSEINISARIKRTRNTESNAIKAKDLNEEIRQVLRNIRELEIKFEVQEDNGVFYFSSGKNNIGGFDFAILNHYDNILALRNLCFGSLQYADGVERWNRFLKKNPELKEIAKNLLRIEEKGINVPKINEQLKTPLIVGEIQFGNWALAYRDFFKVLKADVQNSIDCLIYIVPTGNLESLLSKGIVTFDKSRKIIEDFSKVISVPIWLIGIDIKNK
jgi:hypothetical protein